MPWSTSGLVSLPVASRALCITPQIGEHVHFVALGQDGRLVHLEHGQAKAKENLGQDRASLCCVSLCCVRRSVGEETRGSM